MQYITPASGSCTVNLVTAQTSAVNVAIQLGTNSAPVTMPSSITIPAGAVSASFGIRIPTVTVAAAVWIAARSPINYASVWMEAEPPLAINSLSCSPSHAVTPATFKCAVGLNEATPSGATVKLVFQVTGLVITMPTSVVVAAGSSSASFSISVSAVKLVTTAPLVATLNTSSKIFDLILDP
jgi:hypothetical protein